MSVEGNTVKAAELTSMRHTGSHEVSTKGQNCPSTVDVIKVIRPPKRKQEARGPCARPAPLGPCEAPPGRVELSTTRPSAQCKGGLIGGLEDEVRHSKTVQS